MGSKISNALFIFTGYSLMIIGFLLIIYGVNYIICAGYHICITHKITKDILETVGFEILRVIQGPLCIILGQLLVPSEDS